MVAKATVKNVRGIHGERVVAVKMMKGLCFFFTQTLATSEIYNFAPEKRKNDLKWGVMNFHQRVLRRGMKNVLF